MTTQKEWEDEVRAVYDKIKSHKRPYQITVNDIELTVFLKVFSPAYFTDSRWFAEALPEIVGRKRLLEIGTGTGIVALFAALNGAEVTATDINPYAVDNAWFNFRKYGLEIHVLWGDMYRPLTPDERFDFIFWNHPFNKGEDPDEEMLLLAGFDYKYNSLETYIREAHLHLKPNGRLLLGTGNFARTSEIEGIAGKYGYEMILLRNIVAPLTEDSKIANEYRIYELNPEKTSPQAT